jgi:predicted P-loop ATPase
MTGQEVLQLRFALHELGYLPIPLFGKEPPIYGKNNKHKGLSGWQLLDNVTPEQIDMWSKSWPDANNTGILTRITPALDLDILHEDAAVAAENLVRERFEERGYILVRIGLPPKRAILFRTLTPFKKIAFEFAKTRSKLEKIEFLCNGQQLVANGIHPETGKPYSWFGGTPWQISHDDLPYISEEEARQLVIDIAELLCRDFGYSQSKTTPPPSNGSHGPRPSGTSFNYALVALERECAAVINAQSGGRNDQLNRSSFNLGQLIAAGALDESIVRERLYNAAAACGLIKDDGPQQVHSTINSGIAAGMAKPRQQQTTSGSQPSASPSFSPPPSSPPPPPPHAAGPQPSGGQQRPHPSQLRAVGAGYMRGKAKFISNAGNILLALEQEPGITNAFGYDEMVRTEMLRRPLFVHDPYFTPRPVTDADVTAVQAHLQWLGFHRAGSATTSEAISKYAREHSFHPVRNYLDQLKWDGEARLCTWLTDYLGTELSEYTAEVGIMFLISLVARIYQPGCPVNYMIILEGKQGTLKSTACHVLAGSYFSDSLPDITSKEAFQHLRGKWLVEVAELRAYSRAAIDHFKEFLVRDVERYRPPWGHKDVHEPRQCVFIGTTNKELYLKDETGNRRFWPVKTSTIDINALRRDRDQLFAEAVMLYHKHVPWWPSSKFERDCIAVEQEARFEPDPWEKPIADYLNGKSRTTVLEIVIGVLAYEFQSSQLTYYGTVHGTPINRLTPKDQTRIAAILTHLKWRPRRNMTERWWEPE